MKRIINEIEKEIEDLKKNRICFKTIKTLVCL